MGSTLSKAKHQLPFITSHSKMKVSGSNKIEIPEGEEMRLSRQKTRSVVKEKKTKYRKKHHHYHHHTVRSISVNKRTKPKYKKVTKSIIGKPTNFKHTGHMGADDMLGNVKDAMALSNELNNIAKQINRFDTSAAPTGRIPTRQRQKAEYKRSSPPPPLPPHLYISVSMKKRAALRQPATSRSSAVPASFQRRQQRKTRYQLNLGLVNKLMIEMPSLRSITAT